MIDRIVSLQRISCVIFMPFLFLATSTMKVIHPLDDLKENISCFTMQIIPYVFLLTLSIVACKKGASEYHELANEYFITGALRDSLGDHVSARSYYGKALKYYTKAIQLDHNNAPSYQQRSGLKFTLNDTIGAIIDNTKLIDLQPWNSTAYHNRGALKELLGDYRGALVDYDKAISLDSSWLFSYYFRGELKGKLGDWAGALSDFNKELKLNPKNAAALFSRGMIKINLGDNAGGCSDLTGSGELGHVAAFEAIKKNCN